MNILGKLNISKNSGGSSNYPEGLKIIHRPAQTAFIRVVTPGPWVPKLI